MQPFHRRIGHWLSRGLRRTVATRERRRGLLALAVAALLYPLTAGEPMPAQRNDLCALFAEKPSWYAAMRTSAERWGISIPTQMAILHRESNFYSRARPPRTKIFGFLPGPRLSTAYGYAQVLDGTWQDFRQQAGEQASRRDRFDDVARFMGWYLHRLHHATNIPKDDVYRLYLAYHEGPGGYLRGSAEKKAWLLRTADEVAQRSALYGSQLATCDRRLARHRLLRQILVIVLCGAFAYWTWRRW